MANSQLFLVQTACSVLELVPIVWNRYAVLLKWTKTSAMWKRTEGASLQEGEVTLELVMWEEKYSNDGRANKMQGMKRSNSDTCSAAWAPDRQSTGEYTATCRWGTSLPKSSYLGWWEEVVPNYSFHLPHFQVLCCCYCCSLAASRGEWPGPCNPLLHSPLIGWELQRRSPAV